MIAFQIAGILSTILFMLLLLLAVYNTIFFLFRQGRYRIYFISCFYGFSYIVILMRLTLAIMLTCVIFNYANNGDKLTEKTLQTFVTLQIIAAYAKICMGYFQVVAIVILTLQVKQKYTDQIDKISYWLYFAATVWNACLVTAMLSFCIILFKCLEDKGGNRDCYLYTDLGTILNGVCFATLSLMLIATVIPLFSALNTL